MPQNNAIRDGYSVGSSIMCRKHHILFFCEERGKIGDLKARQACKCVNGKGVRVRGRVEAI